jgi:chromosome segregation ATPase
MPYFASNSVDKDKKDKQAALRRLQSEMVILDSDRVKMERKTADLDLELRNLQRKWTAMGLEIKEKQELLKKTRQNLGFVTEEIRQLKKKINNL